ncbi:MAG: hypothetical protein ACJASY_002561 [Halioglobus sp.]|jgi:hypothetical protein
MHRGFSLKAFAAGVLTIAATLSSNSTLAVEPANIQAGPLYIVPTLDVKTGYVDNLFRSRRDEKSTWTSEVTPKMQAWLQSGVNTYSLAYEVVDYHYENSGRDNYTDQQVNLDIHHEFNAKHEIDLFGEYYDGHEKRGTGLTDGFGNLIDAPVEYVRETYGGTYTYGNNSSRGRLRLEAKSADFDFQNFRNFTRFRDREQDILSGTFFWKVASRTDALVQVRAIDNEYDRANPFDSAGSFDSEEYNYLVGVSWEATAKTRGSIKIGAYDREYDSSARKDDDGFQWEVDLTYLPRTYSSIEFETRRYSQETNGLGDSINTQEYELAWDHNWSGRSATKISVLTGTEDYSGIARKDDRFDVEAIYSYSAQRWLDLGAGFRREDRDSDDARFDYKRNVFFIEANVSL